MVERLLSMQEVLGSIPRFSSFFVVLFFVSFSFCHVVAFAKYVLLYQ